MTKRCLVALARVLSAIVLLVALLSVVNFPYSMDAPLTSAELAAARKYYTEIYMKPADDRAADTDYDRRYQEVAEQEAKHFKITEQVSEFVKRFELRKKPVLEIGSGRGYLQDIAEN